MTLKTTLQRGEASVSRFIHEIRARLRASMNRTPLWLAFSLLMAFFLGVTSLSLIYSDYRWSRDNAIRRHASSVDELLELKLQNLDSYLSTLSDFCVLPVYDTAFYHCLLSSEEPDDDTLSRLFNTVSQNYYTRTDLTAYRIDMLNHGISFVRGTEDQRMKIYRGTDVSGSQEYEECLLSRQHSAVFPSENSGSLLRFCHTIIRISDSRPVALVTIEVNSSIMDPPMGDGILALYNKDGDLVYTNAAGELRDEITSGPLSLEAVEARTSNESKAVPAAGDSYLFHSRTSSSTGLILVDWTPLSSITDELHEIRNFAILQGLLFLVLSLGITIVLIRYLTSPLTTLANSQNMIASGRFPRINIGRCREAAVLSHSFNEMSRHIDELVNDNLIVSLNERNARIEALEAQINPHFLYNTLQAIGSVALMNDQDKIYDMLTKLAANMRYSINGSNEVTLEQEMEFTDNYIDLQKLRMEDRLSVTRDISEELLSIRIPKCSIQLLVENSIRHGMQGEISSLHIQIHAFRKNGLLTIQIRDNGAGMDENTLQLLREKIRNYQPGDTGGSTAGIGLLNLYSRLKIMYDDHADLVIDSCQGNGHHTQVTLTLEDRNA